MSTKYKTASPLNGGLNGWDDDPAGIALSVMGSPTAGLNHSTASFHELGMAERSIVKAPPAEAEARDSAPAEGVCARQYLVEDSELLGVTLARLSLREYCRR